MVKNKTVLITGGARGIGREISLAFSRAGYHIALHCNKSVSEAKELCSEIGDAEYFACDLSQEGAPAAIAGFCPEPEVLVNNAGIALVKPFDLVTGEEEKELYRVNMLAPIELSRLLLPAMIRRRSGSIINVSSVFGQTGGSCEVDYSASKAALIGFTRALAKEVSPSGVRVNCVAPGAIDTDMNCELSPTELSALCDEIPLERLGRPSEVAEAVLFLASERASYITGAVLDINGGWS